MLLQVQAHRLRNQLLPTVVFVGVFHRSLLRTSRLDRHRILDEFYFCQIQWIMFEQPMHNFDKDQSKHAAQMPVEVM